MPVSDATPIPANIEDIEKELKELSDVGGEVIDVTKNPVEDDGANS